MASDEPVEHLALHTRIRVLAENGGDLLQYHHPAGHRAWLFDSIRELTDAIRRFIDGYDDRWQPLT